MLTPFQAYLARLGEKLWVRPLIMCVLSVAGALVASAADSLLIAPYVPNISLESIEILLRNLSASMLVIATFTVASMVSSYASASRTATPRSFPLIVADDTSQNALATFVGAFIFGIVALVAIKNGYYEKAGRFTLFVLTALIFAIVVLTFVRWVDRIARLGRMGNTIATVEGAAARAMRRRTAAPRLGGIAVRDDLRSGQRIWAKQVGYVQRIEMDVLQTVAQRCNGVVVVHALPGCLATAEQPLAEIVETATSVSEDSIQELREAFALGRDRTFEDDPRFGILALAEIASRALSPGINDSGTAIAVIGSLTRLLADNRLDQAGADAEAIRHPLVMVPELCADDLVNDAFGMIARNGAGKIEVVIRLQKGLRALAAVSSGDLGRSADSFARSAAARAENALEFAEDRARLLNALKKRTLKNDRE